MKKIPSLFKRDYEGTWLVYDEIVEGSEWVITGEGKATEKFDGTACMIQFGALFRRYDRKPTKAARRRHKRSGEPYSEGDFKPAPANWLLCEKEPDLHTGHWPGWVPVGVGPQDQWHREAFECKDCITPLYWQDGTYELVGPKVRGNPYGLNMHHLWLHGSIWLIDAPRDFESLKSWFETPPTVDPRRLVEGIVWHHEDRRDGRMVKIKRRDFGLPWPTLQAASFQALSESENARESQGGLK